jgi:hypothetical protein
MKSIRFVLACAALLLVLGVSVNTASADCGGGGYGVGNCWFGNLNAFGSSGTLYGSNYLSVPPYFAVHPPVYYSHNYYRPYGWSPFPMSGNATPNLSRPQPMVVLNPHVNVKPKSAVAAPEDSMAMRSEMIHNPFFVRGQETGQGRLVSTAK